MTKLYNKLILPSPLSVLPLFLKLMAGELGVHFLVSTLRVIIAIPAAVITAVPAGLVLGQMETLNLFFSLLISVLYAIPKIVLLPVIYVLFIAEQSLTEYGLGYFIIVRAHQSLGYKEMYAGIHEISLLGFLLYYLTDILEWRVSRHR